MAPTETRTLIAPPSKTIAIGSEIHQSIVVFFDDKNTEIT